ncbi:MAG: hypothetical protein M3347_02400 [Armatimonadota bacterium]|nr:hypothetical protein [Armatimonadota bacterium]
MHKSKRNNPLWETAVMFVSFLLLWAWFLTHKMVAQPPSGRTWVIWQLLLIIALTLLIAITVRRVRRLQQAFRGEDDDPLPSPFPPLNGHARK